MAAILINLDGAQIEQIVNDALPLRHATAAGGQAIEQLPAQHQSQKRTKNMAADGSIGAIAGTAITSE